MGWDRVIASMDWRSSSRRTRRRWCWRVERDPALTGSYSGISPMGLVWSQVQVIPPDLQRKPDPLDATRPLTVNLQAWLGDSTVAIGSFVQHYFAAGVVRREVRDDG